MTREEQLDWLCRLRSEIYVYMPQEWIVNMDEALTQSIKALEQEPCTDAVSREDAIEAVKQAIYYHDSAIMRLTELPSVTQKSDKYRKEAKRWKNKWLKSQKSGKWIERQNIARTSIATAIEFRWTYECSECGHEVRHKTRFCASCGCRMESDGE